MNEVVSKMISMAISEAVEMAVQCSPAFPIA